MLTSESWQDWNKICHLCVTAWKREIVFPVLLVNTPLGLAMRNNYGPLHLHTQERSEWINVGYSWLVLFHDEHYNVHSPPVLKPTELLHHASSWRNGALRTAALGNYLKSHWITKMFIANHPKILRHFPKEVTSPALLYSHRWLKEISQALRSRVARGLELMPFDSEHQTPACLPFCLFPAPSYPWIPQRQLCSPRTTSSSFPNSSILGFSSLHQTSEFGRIKAEGNK